MSKYETHWIRVSPLLHPLPPFLPMQTSLRFSSFPYQQPNQTLTLTLAPPHRRRRLPAISAAISRSKKEQTVDSVKTHLENCHLLAGINFQRFTVKQFQELRRALPPSVRLLVAKNNLVGKAIEGTQWEALRPCMKGMNAWLFVQTEEIPEAIKPYRSFQRERKLEENDFVGGVFEGRFYGPEEFGALETMMSRGEVYARLVGLMRSPAVGIVGALQAPAREVVMVLKAWVKKMEEEGGVDVGNA